MISEISCSLCGKKCTAIKCGDRKKLQTKKTREKESNYICVQCKKKGNGEYKNSFANHQQHELYFNEEE